MDQASIIALVALMVSFISMIVAYITYKDSHGHERLNETLEYMRDWDEKTLTSRVIIMEIQDVYEKATPDVIPLEKIIKIRTEPLRKIKSGELDSGTLLITDHITILLNYIDLLATAINMGIIEEKYVYEYLGQAIKRWFNVLRNYRSEFNDKPEKRTRHPWRAGEKLVEKWTKETPITINMKPPGTKLLGK